MGDLVKSASVAKLVFGSVVYGVPGMFVLLEIIGVKNALVDLCSAWFVIAVAMTIFVYLILIWSEKNKLEDT